ncbi:MAG: aldehyde dehydrogenase family protein [Desulfobacterales bacterium]|nr:aldehyde dehydrogenase family protein [Desulfobacterales bacterium]MBF0396864.1 aldehyde dehydrogenase family protein [Desulfobacterales bacterium]
MKKANFINGKWVENRSKDFLDVNHKYTGALLAKLPLASEQDIEDCITGLESGFKALKQWSAEKRADALNRLSEELALVKEDFSQLIVAEAGKPISYARGEIERCITTLKTAAREAFAFTGETIPIDYGIGQGKTAFTKPFPIGPVLGISPFNFPMNLALHKIAPALAVGCSIVIKPSPQAPLSCLSFASLCEKVGYPKGAINVIVCNNLMAEKMVRDPRIRMLSFTGSSKVGWYLKTIAGHKKILLELGGNAAVIIDESANLEEAARLTVQGAYIYAGQVCISVQRIYVHKNIFDEFLSLLLKNIKAVQTGDPHDPKTIVGPMIDSSNVTRIHSWIQEAVSEGAKILAGGVILDETHHIYAPTLITQTKPHMKIVCEEAFGPVAVIEQVNDFSEALDMTNQSDYGLQAGVFTNQINHMKQSFETLETGAVIINYIPGFRVDSMPYGGIKDSGLGREGIRYAMQEMTENRLLVY